VEAILLDGIDTMTTWRVEIESHVMEEALEWLEKDALEEVVGRVCGRGGCSSAMIFIRVRY
jgi:hypothetical protein